MDTHRKLQFTKEALPEFYYELKQKISPLIAANASMVTRFTTIKVILFPILYASFYVLLLNSGNRLEYLFLSYALLGILMPITVLNTVHDAAHHCLLKNKKANSVLMHLLDVLGGDSFVWQKRHVRFHHPYANVTGWDIDLEKKKLMKLSPADEYKNLHRYQHIYLPFLFPLFTLQWVLFRDFKDYFDPGSMFRKKTKVPVTAFLKLVIFKVLYFTYILVIPALILEVRWYHITGGFLLMHALAGVLTLVIVLPNHWDEEVKFVTPGDRLIVHENWAYHQLQSANDFSTGNKWITFFAGGLNHHVAHHLFPNLNHNYLPAITREISKMAKERNLPYTCYSFTGALRSHLKLLKNNGYKGNIFNE